MRRGIQFFVTVVLFLTAVLFFQQVFSYDTNIAHPFLTEKVIDLYNSQNSNKISAAEKDLIIAGSREEDTPIRWMNHFYNPITNEGLWGFETAKDWNRDSGNQENYTLGDQSWDTAIDAYAKGDKAKALEALGHVLHLLEDMAVPAHTRLDVHAEGDPFEVWVKDNPIDFSVSQIERYGQIDYYFYQLATFSNSNFFSKDTLDREVLSKFQLKSLLFNGRKINCVIGKISGGQEFCIATVDEDFVDPKNNFYYFSSKNHSDYYSLLAPKAVSYGAGVIKLFFDEGEKRKAELAKEQSELWQRIKNLFIIQDPGAAGQSAPTVQPPYISPDSSQSSTPAGSQTAIAGQPQSAVKKSLTSSKPTIQTPAPAESIYPPEINYPTENPLPLTKKFVSAPTSSFFFGSGKVYGGSKTESPLVEEPAEEITPEPPAPTSTEPLPDTESPPAPLLDNLFLEIFFTTSTETEIFGFCSADTAALAVYWAADAISTPILSPAVFTIATSTSNSSTWRATTELNPGQNFWYFSAIDEANNTSTLSAPARFVLDTAPPEIQSFVATTTSTDTSTLVHLEWAATDTLSAVADYDLDYVFDSGDTNILLENSSSTFFDFSATTIGQYDFYLRARDAVGNFSDWATTSATVAPPSYSYNYLDGAQTDDEVILTATGSPYILKQYSVPAGKTLRIEPGAIIKGLEKKSRLEIYGTLSATGTTESRIIFTSVQDRSFGGGKMDTPDLGEDREPFRRDWSVINFYPGSFGNFAFADFRYSGYDYRLPCIAAYIMCDGYSRTLSLDAATVSLADSSIIQGGIFTIGAYNSSTLSISNTTLTGSGSSGDDFAIEMTSRGSLFLDNVQFTGYLLGVVSLDNSSYWPTVTVVNMSLANFVNVLIPWDPEGLMTL